jgi:NAD(P)-dependent dehydrogenase (short-subunit alcohol dehydrogenase family)
MKKQSFGRIVNIGSIWVDFSKENRVSYSASKNALHSLTKSIVSEFSQYNILANTVSPGYISTDMTFKNNTKEQISQIIKNIPLDRLGYPAEVADLVYFLTVNNSYISGQNIVIDGGYSCTAK